MELSIIDLYEMLKVALLCVHEPIHGEVEDLIMDIPPPND